MSCRDKALTRCAVPSAAALLDQRIGAVRPIRVMSLLRRGAAAPGQRAMLSSTARRLCSVVRRN